MHGCVVAALLAASGCAVRRARDGQASARRPLPDVDMVADRAVDSNSRRSRALDDADSESIRRVAHEEFAGHHADEAAHSLTAGELPALVATALAVNPRLAQMQQEAAAAWDRVRYIDKLPDPMIGAMGIAPPMHFVDGRQFAAVSMNQRIPWLKRLSAQEQQACFQAWALDAAWQAERLRTIAAVKVAWSRLYVVEQQLRINQGNRELIDLLIRVATDRVVAQSATEGDVLLGTLELSRLTEEQYALEERRASLRAALNRLLNRPAETPIWAPTELEPADPAWGLETLRQTAWANQPDIAAAQLRAQAGAWGIRVAELERRPEVTLNFDWLVMAPQREPGMPEFGGQDSFQLGAMVSVPLWHEKYNAMRDEAVRESMARQFSVQDVQREYEAMLAELLEQARAAARTARLYNGTMLPQARRTFEADQRAYVGPGTVEFDRVIEDFRTVLTLEEGYHRSVGDWAIAVARIEQAVARDIGALPALPEPAPPADAGPNDIPPHAATLHRRPDSTAARSGLVRGVRLGEFDTLRN
jgi:outer membrane protein TolC